MTDSNARLLAAVTARRELAQAAEVGPWNAETNEHGAAWVSTQAYHHAWGMHGFPESALFIVANDPAQILRDTEAHLKILERHQLVVYGEDEPEPLIACAWCEGHYGPPYPCPHVLDLAGIYPEVTE